MNDNGGLPKNAEREGGSPGVLEPSILEMSGLVEDLTGPLSLKEYMAELSKEELDGRTA